jgi:hypothetical protein
LKRFLAYDPEFAAISVEDDDAHMMAIGHESANHLDTDEIIEPERMPLLLW